MGLQYAVLFACIAAACAWKTQMTIKNLENNPLLNNLQLGPLQSAWKALEKASNDSYVLMFRSKNHEPEVTCVTVKAAIYDATEKTANYTRTYYNKTLTQYVNVTFPVRALNQSGYSVENVVRAGLKGSTPSATPVPMGSNTYIEYGDYDCNSSSTPFRDMAVSALAGQTAAASAPPTAEAIEGRDYLDFYVVFNQPTCNVLRAPLLQGGCDFWLKQSELNKTLTQAHKITEKGDQEEEKSDDEEDDSRGEEFNEAVFKSLPTSCRFAFLAACGYPNNFMYNETACKTQQPATAKPSA